MAKYSCHDSGHVWIEADGSVYIRHRGRPDHNVSVSCKYCPAHKTLPAYSKHTAPPLKMPAKERSHHGSVPKVT